MSNQSDTPLTDAVEFQHKKQYELEREAGWPPFDGRPFDFARTIEKKLNEARAASIEYIARTDPLLSCGHWLHGGEENTPCKSCGACVHNELQQLHSISERLAKFAAHQSDCSAFSGSVCDCGRNQIIADYNKLMEEMKK